MAKKEMPTVRVIWYVKGPDDQSGLLIEQLRRMRFLNVLKDFTPLSVEEIDKLKSGLMSRLYEGYYVLEFPTPKGFNELWAKGNADRMQSFGINAVEAPRWGTEHETMSTWIDIRHSSHVDGNQ